MARRHVYLQGQWHLWIYCCLWAVRDGARLAGDSSSPRSATRAAAFLDGQQLVSVSIGPRGVRTAFEFDLGGRLLTAPYDRSREQWLLYEPSGKVLVLRADRTLSHTPGSRREAPSDWRKF